MPRCTTTSNEHEKVFFSSIAQPQMSKSHRSLKSETQILVKTWLKASPKEVLTTGSPGTSVLKRGNPLTTAKI